MKKNYTLFLLFISIIFSSCSNDNEISESFIDGHTFKLTAFKLSQKVDLNLDGTPSIDMIHEFECIGNEEISFNSTEIEIINKKARLVGTISNTSTSSTIDVNYYECTEYEDKKNFISIGNYKIVNNNIIEADIKNVNNFRHSPYKISYTIDSKRKKITQTLTQKYPTTYNLQTGKWLESSVEIKREFTRL